jgi:hypothetical protein
MELGDSGPFGAGSSGLADLREFSCARENRVSWPGAAGWAERSVSRPLLPVRNCRKGSITNLNPRPQIKSSRSAPGSPATTACRRQTPCFAIENSRQVISDCRSCVEDQAFAHPKQSQIQNKRGLRRVTSEKSSGWPEPGRFPCRPRSGRRRGGRRLGQLRSVRGFGS